MISKAVVRKIIFILILLFLIPFFNWKPGNTLIMMFFLIKMHYSDTNSA